MFSQSLAAIISGLIAPRFAADRHSTTLHEPVALHMAAALRTVPHSMQIFHRSTNTLSRATIYGAVFVVAALFWAAAEIQRSPYVTYAGVRRPQPVPFSHQHHVSGLGIDCRYCHTSVETSS